MVGQGKAQTLSPTTRNEAVEIPTFGELAEVSTVRGRALPWANRPLAQGSVPAR